MKTLWIALIECGHYCEDNEVIESAEVATREELSILVARFLNHPKWEAGMTQIEIWETVTK